MATLPAVLIAQTGIPAQVEAKFGILPKIAPLMAKLAGKLPAGPDILPSMLAKAPVLPNIPNPPALFKGTTTTTTTATAGLPLSPRTPGAPRGSVDYGVLATAPMTPGVGRGNVIYGS